MMGMGKMYNFLYLLILVFLIIVPGSALVMVKALLLSIFFVCSTVFLIKRKVSTHLYIGVFYWLSLVLIWGLIGLFNNDVNDAGREFVAYLVFALLVSFLIVHHRYIDPIKFRFTLITSILLYAVVKFGFIFLVLTGRMSPFEAYELMKDFAPGVVVSSFMGDGLPRFVMANDYLLPIFLAWLLFEYSARRIGKFVFGVAMFVSFILIAITLSRYLYAFTLCILLARVFLFLKRPILSLSVLVGIAVAVVGGGILLENLGYGDILYARFFGQNAASSNSAKSGQIGPLVNLLDSGLLFGHGFGLSLESTGRGNKEVFQSEIQWLSLTTKIGFLGMVFVVVMLLAYLRKILIDERNRLSERVFIFILFAIWLSAGLFNPVLLLTTTAVNYLLIYMMCQRGCVFMRGCNHVVNASVEI